MTVGADAALWFTEPNDNRIGRISTAGLVTEYVLPWNGRPNGIASGPDGALWFTSSLVNSSGSTFSVIGRITTLGAITSFPLPFLEKCTGITAGPDGALWFTISDGGSGIGRITMAGTVNRYSIPGLNATQTDGSPSAITAGPDGALWFTVQPEAFTNGGLLPGNAIGRMTTSGVGTLFPIPTPKSYPLSIVAGPDGALWFTEKDAAKIGRITTAGVITEIPVGRKPGDSVRGFTMGPDGAFWFTYSGLLARITTRGVETFFDNIASSDVLTVGPDGALWIANVGAGINQVTVSSVGQTNRIGTFAQIAAGGSWDTTVTLINRSASSVSATINLYADDGPLMLPLKITQNGVSRTVTEASVNISVAPNSSTMLAMGAPPAGVRVGWADVWSAGALHGYGVLRFKPSDDKASEATVAMQSSFPARVTLPFDNEAGYATGVAVANLGNRVASILVTAWDDSGTQLGQSSVALREKNHASFGLTDYIPATAGKRGIVEFANGDDGGVSALGFRFSPAGPFTNVPLIPH